MNYEKFLILMLVFSNAVFRVSATSIDRGNCYQRIVCIGPKAVEGRVTEDECRDSGGRSWQRAGVCTVLGGTSNARGDPHFATWNGRAFQYHGECDLVLVQNEVFADGLGLDIHIRTERLSFYSFINGVALRIGNDVLEVMKGGEYYVNGALGKVVVTTEDTEEQEPTEYLSGFPLTHSNPVQKPYAHFYTIDLPGERERILIKSFKEFMAVMVESPQSNNFAGSVGLFGTFPDGAMKGRDGETLYNDGADFGPEWQVNDSDPTLFLEPRFPQYPNKCLPPYESVPRRLGDVSKISEEAAKKACEQLTGIDLEACVFDVQATGDLDMAEAHVW